MTTSLESSTSSTEKSAPAPPPRWIRIGLVAGASAVLGGMAAAWWYRKTLIRLRQAEETGQNPQFGITDEDSAEDF